MNKQLPSEAVLQTRGERVPPLPIELRAGPLTMSFEPHTAFLRYVRLGDREVVRGIYSAVRDHNWDTVTPQVVNLQSQVSDNSFALSFEVRCQQMEVDFSWQGKITGKEDGTVTFEMRGEAHSSFRRNRIGFCILHPIRECSGQACIIEHTDGNVEYSEFPNTISPHQPFLDIRAITHQVLPEVQAEIRFSGDVFEMEDQRNWTDASFKTYCTPLSLPFPVDVQAGTRIEQSVTLRLLVSPGQEAYNQVPTSAVKDEVIISIDEATAYPLPALGLGMAEHEVRLTDNEANLLLKLAPAHLRVDLHLAESYLTQWQRAQEEAEALATSLEIALFVTSNIEAELQRFVKAVNPLPLVVRWIVFHKDEKTTSLQSIELARRYLAAISSAPVGAGTNAYFAEVNRVHPPLSVLDFVSFSLNPQVHAFDNASIVETLEAQASVIKSAHACMGGLPIVVSPVTLKPRFNPNATGKQPPLSGGELPSSVDVRQLSLFGAAWTLGSIKYLSESGVSSVTYYETTGWRGVMEASADSLLREKFPSLPSSVFPLYHVLADVAEFAGGEVLASRSSVPLQVECLALRRNGHQCLLLGNFSAQSQRVQLQGVNGQARIKSLSATNIPESLLKPETYRQQPGISTGQLVELAPYAVARIDFIGN